MMPSAIAVQMTAILRERKQNSAQLSKQGRELVDCRAKQSLFPLHWLHIAVMSAHSELAWSWSIKPDFSRVTLNYSFLVLWVSGGLVYVSLSPLYAQKCCSMKGNTVCREQVPW